MIPLRPLRIGEILDGAFRLFRATVVPVATVVALVLGGFHLVSSFLVPPSTTVESFQALFDPALAGSQTPGAGELLGGLLALLVLAFVEPIVRGGVTSVALARDRGEDPGWRDGLRAGWRRAGRLIGATLLVGLVAVAVLAAVFVVILLVGVAAGLAAAAAGAVGVVIGIVVGLLGFVLAMAATLILLATVRLTIPIVMVEVTLPLGRVVARAFRIARSQRGRVLAIVVLTFLLVMMIQFIMTIPGLALVLVNDTLAAAVTGVLTVATVAVTLPLESNVALMLYVDHRVRDEGLDVAVASAELDTA